MTLREFIDAILQLIGADSVTDVEFETIDEATPIGQYTQSLYDQVSAILLEREAISDIQEKLIAFFRVKDVIVNPAKTGSSNIYLGDVLD